MIHFICDFNKKSIFCLLCHLTKIFYVYVEKSPFARVHILVFSRSFLRIHGSTLFVTLVHAVAVASGYDLR